MRDPASEAGPPAAADRYLAAIASSSHDAIIATDVDGRITFWSAGAQRLYGWTPPEALGRPIDELVVPDEDRLTYADIRARGGQGERVDDVRTARVTKGGGRAQVSATVSPIRDDAGQTIVSLIERECDVAGASEARTTSPPRYAYDGAERMQATHQRPVGVLAGEPSRHEP